MHPNENTIEVIDILPAVVFGIRIQDASLFL